MKIFAYPRDWNPYQDLLYGAMGSRVRVCYGKNYPYIGALLFPVLAVLYRLAGCRVVHIHWQALALHLPFLNKQQNQRVSLKYYRLCYRLLRRLGYKIVWTVHNVLPHEPQTSDDQAVAQLLARLADAKIVHSAYTIQQMQEQGLDTSRTHVIPHGNYDGVYPTGQTPEQARQRLGIAPDEQVFLFFGNIRTYKGVPELLDAYKQVRTKKTRLVIAGKTSESELHQQLADAAADDPSILFHDQRIPDADVATYFLAADVLCLPFKSITTSGSIILAATFGKPLIAPQLGAVQDIPNDAGSFYDPTVPQALQQSMQRIIKDPATLHRMAQASAAYAATLAWDGIADKTYDVYQQILGEQRHV